MPVLILQNRPAYNQDQSTDAQCLPIKWHLLRRLCIPRKVHLMCCRRLDVLFLERNRHVIFEIRNLFYLLLHTVFKAYIVCYRHKNKLLT